MKRNKNSEKETTAVPAIDPNFRDVHGKPASKMNRRELLQSGAVPFAAYVALPSFVQLFAKAGVAQAQETINCTKTGSVLPPIITINLAGGAGIHANIIPLQKTGELLPTYDKLGLGDRATVLAMQAELMGVKWNNTSGIYSALMATATNFANTPALRLNVHTNTAAYWLGVQNMDDSSNNAMSITGLLQGAGLRGSILGDLATRDTPTGDNNRAAKILPLKGTLVRSYDDILAALGPGSSLNLLAQSSRVELFNSIRKLTASQARNLASMSGGEALAQLSACASQENAVLQSGSGANTNLSPRSAPAQVQTIWGINANTQNGAQNFVFASMVYNALAGNCAHVSLSLGGYDYHNGTRTTGEAKDAEAGNLIAKILATAAAMNRPVFIYVNTDGSVRGDISNSPTVPWRSDNGSAGVMLGFAFDPMGKPAAARTQIGGFSVGQGVEAASAPTAGNAEVAATAMFANYLSFGRQLQILEKVAPRTFSTADLDKILAIRRS